jgi:hypothetical protein
MPATPAIGRHLATFNLFREGNYILDSRNQSG